MAVRQDLGDGWFAIYHLGDDGVTHIDIQRSGRLIHRRWPRGHGKGAGKLKGRAVRQLRPGAALAAARRARREGGQLERLAQALHIRPLTESSTRLHRLATLAAHYTEALDAGSRKPVQDVADKLDMDPEHVRDGLHAARTEDLITRAGRGRAGGELTDKALALLKEEEE